MEICVRNLRNGEEEWFDIYKDIDEIREALAGEKPEPEYDEDGDEIEVDDEEHWHDVEELKVVDIDLDDLRFRASESEWEDVPKILEFANWYDGLASYEQRAFCAYCEAGYSDTMDNQSGFEKGDYSYYDEDDWEDLGYELMHSMDRIPEWLENYIDYEKFGEDSGYTKTDFGFIQIF